MSADAFALVHSFAVGKHTVTISFPPGDDGDVVNAFIEWVPPRDGPLSAADLAIFRAGKHRAMSDLAVATGQAIEQVRTSS